MTSFLSPGVFIEEVSNTPQTVQAVGTSTMAIVGWTPQGPVNEATLVSSSDAFTRTFGAYSAASLVPIEVYAYFANGGTRAYVVRVAPSDAIAASTLITNVYSAAAPTWSPVPDGTLLGPFTATLSHIPLTSAVITLHWTETAVPKTATITGTNTVGGTNAANISAATIDRTTGAISVTFVTAHGPEAASLTVDYTAELWALAAISPGAWGNNILVTISGSPNFLVYGPTTTTGAGTYSKFNVTVSQLNSSGVYEIRETYEDVVVSDTTDAMYITDVINHGSDLVTLTDVGALKLPSGFYGVAHTAESAGSPDGAIKTFTHTASGTVPVLKASLVVHYTIGAVVHAATADASGTITGTGIDATKTNTINYATGLVTLNFSTAPDTATTLTIDYVSMPTTTSVDYSLTSGSDGTISNLSNTTISNAVALKSGKLGMYALDRVDEMMQLVIPDFAGDTVVQGDMIDYAESRRDIFCILCGPSGKNDQAIADYARITFGRKSKYAAMYWPWVNVADPSAPTRTLLIPPVGHVAGIYARTDANKNVSKAPAGTVDGALRGVVSLEFNPDEGERNTVYPARVNPLINTPQTGMCVWGTRTMSPLTDVTRFIGAVRLFIFVEKSIFNSTQNYIFESINQNLYTQIKTQLDSFLLDLYNNAHFAGSSPQLAFTVQCDKNNNPPEVVDQGQVIVDVAIAPNRPGEFLRIRISQKSLS